MVIQFMSFPKGTIERSHWSPKLVIWSGMTGNRSKSDGLEENSVMNEGYVVVVVVEEEEEEEGIRECW